MAPRLQVQPIDLQEVLRPQATPVDSYVRPAPPQSSSLNGLAEALSGFSRDLDGFIQKRKGDQDEKDKIRGEAAFWKNNSMGAAEAVRQGRIPAFASPTFMEAYKNAEGAAAGKRLASQARLAYQTWEGRNDQDPTIFDRFMADFMRQSLTSNDPDVLAGALPYVRSTADQLYNANTQERADSAYNTSLNSHVASAGRDMDADSDEGLRSGQGTNYDAMWDKLIQTRSTFLGSGGLEADADKQFIDLITAKAEEEGDPAILALLNRKLPGKDYSFAETPYGRKVQEGAVGGFEDRAWKASERQRKLFEEKEKTLRDEEQGFILEQLSKDPDFVFDEAFITAAAKRDPEVRIKISNWRNTLSDRAGEEDPDEVAQLYSEIFRGGGREVIDRGISQGIVRKGATISALTGFLGSQGAGDREGSKGVFNSALNGLRRLTQPAFKDGMLFDPNYQSSASIAVEIDFRAAVMAWDKSNPQATPDDRNAAIGSIFKNISTGIASDLEGAAPTYTRPDNLPNANPLAETKADQVAEQQAAQARLTAERQQLLQQPKEAAYPTSQGSDWSSPMAPPELGKLPAEQRQQIETIAKQRGIDPEILKNRMWRKTQERILAGADATSLQRPQQQPPSSNEERRAALSQQDLLSAGVEGVRVIGNSLLNTVGLGSPKEEYLRQLDERLGVGMQEEDGGTGTGLDVSATNSISPHVADLQRSISSILANPELRQRATESANGLLNLIGKTEGTDRGDGYNETLSYGAYTGGDVNLTSMTLNEVRNLQRQMLRHPDNNQDSSAVGRYQIVGETLKGLMQEMGLSGNEKFDEDMQDRMGQVLLKRRGYDKWQRGEISDKTFLNNLAQEWASLPTAAGRGHYPGQRAAASTNAVLQAAREQRQASASGQPSPVSAGGDIYANIPDTDDGGRGGQKEKFRQWNPDPVANEAKNLKSINPSLASIVTRAKELATKDGVGMVVASGKRTKAMQKKAVAWGWSKTEDSDHIHGDSVDLWALDENGAVIFDKKRQAKLRTYMRRAAKELGVELDADISWDLPHFALKRG